MHILLDAKLRSAYMHNEVEHAYNFVAIVAIAILTYCTIVIIETKSESLFSTHDAQKIQEYGLSVF